MAIKKFNLFKAKSIKMKSLEQRIMMLILFGYFKGCIIVRNNGKFENLSSPCEIHFEDIICIVYILNFLYFEYPLYRNP